MLCLDPWNEPGGYQPFNYAVRCVQAGLVAAGIEGVEVHLVEARSTDAGALLARLEAIDPDVVAASAYVWSFPTFVEVAARLKQRRPDVTVIFGGPSARPAMFALAPFRDRRFAVDALVLGEGEEILPRIVALATRDSAALATIGGLALPTADGFSRTAAASPVESLDELASPYQMGLVPQSFTAHLESFRGCPLSCTFCQWGDSAGNSRIYSRAYLVRQLEAIRALGADQAVLVDAGLNLNPQAFRNLTAAEREVRVLRDIGLHFECYPSHLTDEHVAFLSSIRLRSVGLGLQSYDKDVLRRMQRPFDDVRFERVARQLHELGADVSVEIIMGLPGDTPDAFLRTLDRARKLPCNVRAYHCMVLPDALMTRAPTWAEMDFDPHTLLMRSCAGWTEAALGETSERLVAACHQDDGWTTGKYWFFPREGGVGTAGARPSIPPAGSRLARSSRGDRARAHRGAPRSARGPGLVDRRQRHPRHLDGRRRGAQRPGRHPPGRDARRERRHRARPGAAGEAGVPRRRRRLRGLPRGQPPAHARFLEDARPPLARRRVALHAPRSWRRGSAAPRPARAREELPPDPALAVAGCRITPRYRPTHFVCHRAALRFE